LCENGEGHEQCQSKREKQPSFHFLLLQQSASNYVTALGNVDWA
jgi:hypothetical protein